MNEMKKSLKIITVIAILLIAGSITNNYAFYKTLIVEGYLR
jgi:hypothetical protein